MSARSGLIGLAAIGVFAVAALFFSNRFQSVAEIPHVEPMRMRVTGNSMAPALEEGTLVDVDVSQADYQVGEIIILKSEVLGKFMIKRIVARSGDRIEIEQRDGQWALLVNREAVRNSRHGIIDIGSRKEFLEKLAHDSPRVPNDHYFVFGDNQWATDDSSVFGFVSSDAIVGKVIGHF